MSDWEIFFRRLADYNFETRFYEQGECFEVEELYQAFKARMLAEIEADNGIGGENG